MAKAKIRGHRPGGRNRQFFTNLCSLQDGLDAVVNENSCRTKTDTSAMRLIQESRISKAEAKRSRRMIRNKLLQSLPLGVPDNDA